jgi:hypothetical protein
VDYYPFEMRFLFQTLWVVLLNFVVHTAENISDREQFILQNNSTWSRRSLALDPKVRSKISRPYLSLASISSNLFIRWVAGTSGGGGYGGDNGPATSAQIRGMLPWIDNSGNVYIPDGNNYRIRKVSPAGIISTFGGTGTQSSGGESGPIGSVNFWVPQSIVGDTAGTFLYITDGWYVWKYLFSSGIVSVYAGISSYGFSGDGGPASLAQFVAPIGLSLTTVGDLFVSDNSNHRVRKISSSGIITSVVGSGCVYPCTGGYSGDSGPATSATLKLPFGIYVDTNGKLFVADSGTYRIRMVDTNNIIITFAGSGTASPFNGNTIPVLSANINTPQDVKGDSLGNIYIADYFNCIVRIVDTNGIISTLFGTPGSCAYSAAISLISSRFALTNSPQGIWIDSNSNVFFSDLNSVRRGIEILPTSQPTGQPSRQPTMQPSGQPSRQPTAQPSCQPSRQPTSMPTFHSATFGFTGAVQTFVLPENAQWIAVTVIGASAGAGSQGIPGYGAKVTAKIPIWSGAGTTLYIYVGGVGALHTACVFNSPAPGGWNGGGTGQGCASGGGGASDIRLGGTMLSNRIITAGGGGGYFEYDGSCGSPKGGDAGYTGITGDASLNIWGCGSGGSGGGGGTTTAGGSAGAPGAPPGATPGTLGVGGNATGYGAGGGGGGYYGGIKLFNFVYLSFLSFNWSRPLFVQVVEE